MPTPTAIIQARMGSTRLPGKVLMPLAGHPMLLRVISRTEASGLRVVVATSATRPDDGQIVNFCNFHGIPYFTGSETDVLDRYYQCAVAFDADPIIRITADCPLVDPELVRETVDKLIASEVDYVSVLTDTKVGNRLAGYGYSGLVFPDGLDCEAFTLAALRRTWASALRPYEREHVTPYLYSRGDANADDEHIFRTKHIYPGRRMEPSYKGERWTVDTHDDYDLVARIYDALEPVHGPTFGRAEVMAFLHPPATADREGVC